MDDRLLDSLSEALQVWGWWAGVPWAGVFAGLVAGVFGYRRKHSWMTPSALLVAAAGWFAGPVAAGAACGLVAGWCVAGRWVRWRERAHRALLVTLVVVPLLFTVHLWVRSTIVPVVSYERGLVLGLVVAATIVVLVRPARPLLDPQRLFTAVQRAEVSRRDGHRCGYCGAAGDALGVQLAVDHVVPHSKGGRTEIGNARLACSPCNSLKSDLDWDDFVRVFRRRHGFAPGEFDHGNRILRLFRA